jgi:hypothetical protein
MKATGSCWQAFLLISHREGQTYAQIYIYSDRQAGREIFLVKTDERADRQKQIGRQPDRKVDSQTDKYTA